jgi:hypothetical protein
MRTSVIGAVGLLIILTGCGSGSPTVGAVTGSAPSSGVPPVGSAVGEPEPAPADDSDAESRQTLPDLIGKGLQAAQNRAQGAGFQRMTSHDASGRERVQILDRDWKVCFQKPAAGRHPADTKIDFGTVKLDERCPGRDQAGAPVRPAGSAMPDLRGWSAAAAVKVLGTDASVTWRDGTGADRTVVLPTNWRVCGQTPKPGAGYDGVPVTLTVVKYGEKC